MDSIRSLIHAMLLISIGFLIGDWTMLALGAEAPYLAAHVVVFQYSVSLTFFMLIVRIRRG